MAKKMITKVSVNFFRRMWRIKIGYDQRIKNYESKNFGTSKTDIDDAYLLILSRNEEWP